MSIQITVLGFEPTTFTTWVSSLNRASQYTFLKDNEGKRDTKKEIREEIWRGEIKKCNKELAWQFDENSKNVKWNPLYDKSPFLLLSKNWLKLSGNNSVAKVVVVFGKWVLEHNISCNVFDLVEAAFDWVPERRFRRLDRRWRRQRRLTAFGVANVRTLIACGKNGPKQKVKILLCHLNNTTIHALVKQWTQ